MIKSIAPGDRRIPWIIFLFGFLLYVQTVRYDYCLDDRMLITENNLTTRGLAGIPKILTTDSFYGFFSGRKNFVAGGRYRPLSQIVFAITWQVFGHNPAVGHLLNALLYACTGAVLFLVLRRLLSASDRETRHWSLPVVATALFIAHPVHTEAVANIKGLDEILCLLWSLAALYGALRYAETRQVRHLAAAAGAFLLALLSKENAIAFLAIVPLSLYVFSGKNAWSSLVAALPLLPAVGIYAALRINAIGLPQRIVVKEVLNNPFLYADSGQRYATILATWGRYLKLMLFPHPLTHDYYPHHLRLVGWGDPWAWGSLLVSLGLLAFALVRIRNRHLVAYGVLFFFSAFLLQSNLFFPVGTFMGERFLFTPLLGFTLSLAWLAGPGAGERRRLATALTCVLLAGYAFKTVSRNEAWRDPLTLYSTDVTTSSNSAKCNAALGDVLVELAQKQPASANRTQLLSRALSHYTRAVEILPGYTTGWIEYGNAAVLAGDIATALDCYEAALRIKPGIERVINSLEAAAAQAREQRRYDVAARAHAILAKYQPWNRDQQYECARDLEALGASDDALSLLRKIVQTNPGYYRAYNEIGQILDNRKNDQSAALVNFERAASLTDKDATVWENLGFVYSRAGRYAEAVAALEKSLKINPDNPRAWGRLGDAFLAAGDRVRALECRARQRELTARPR